VEPTEPPAVGQPVDPDTRQQGTRGPFQSWEGDHTALAHVLRAAHGYGLTDASGAGPVLQGGVSPHLPAPSGMKQ
jgi:hypothetical protein